MLKVVKAAQEAEREVPMQPVSLDIWDKKYRLKTKQGEILDETMDDTYQRVARALANAGARRFFVALAEEGAAVRQALGPGPQTTVGMPSDWKKPASVPKATLITPSVPASRRA